MQKKSKNNDKILSIENETLSKYFENNSSSLNLNNLKCDKNNKSKETFYSLYSTNFDEVNEDVNYISKINKDNSEVSVNPDKISQDKNYDLVLANFPYLENPNFVNNKNINPISNVNNID